MNMNIAIPKPECDMSMDFAVRYASTTKRLYVESIDGTRGGCATLSQIWEKIGKLDLGPLYPVDLLNDPSPVETGVWLLAEDLYIEDGITLDVVGTSVGGDADELRLLSNSQTFINLRAHGGSLNFDNTKVISWDNFIGGPDENLEDGRSYISCLSEVMTGETCVGAAKNEMGEGRMDINKSEMGYLGYHASESWGLSYKVRGVCKDESNLEELTHLVNVYGNIYDSEIHHGYYGHYSYGHQGGDWSRNIVHDNVIYGFDPHHGSNNLIIHDNVVYNNGGHGIIASKWCRDVSIQGNEVYDSKVGIFLHRSGDRAIVKDNNVHDCFDTGITFLESSDGIISGNVIERNVIGMRMSVGSENNVISGNSFMENEGYEVHFYEGGDDVVEVETKTLKNNVFVENDFSVVGPGIKLDSTEKIQFLSNTFSGSEIGVIVQSSVNLLVADNVGNLVFDIDSSSCIDPQSDIGDDVNFCAESIEKYVAPANSPTGSPTNSPTGSPTGSPTRSPTGSPTVVFQSVSPTGSPTVGFQSVSPTGSPIDSLRSVDSSDMESSSGSSKFGVKMWSFSIVMGTISVYNALI